MKWCYSVSIIVVHMTLTNQFSECANEIDEIFILIASYAKLFKYLYSNLSVISVCYTYVASITYKLYYINLIFTLAMKNILRRYKIQF